MGVGAILFKLRQYFGARHFFFFCYFDNVVNGRCWTSFFFNRFLTGGEKGICFYFYFSKGVFTTGLLEAWQIHFVCEGC